MTISRKQQLPRNMWRKRHSFPCKSLATNSWVGGCLDMSCKKRQTTVNIYLSQHRIPKHNKQWIADRKSGKNQRRQAFIGVTPQHRKSPVSARIWCCKGLAEWMHAGTLGRRQLSFFLHRVLILLPCPHIQISASTLVIKFSISMN